MSLTSSSTRQDALDQYNDNLNWQGNAAKAALAIEAVRWLLVNRAQSINHGDRSLNYESLIDEKQRLEEYIKKHGSGVNRAAFTQGRMLT